MKSAPASALLIEPKKNMKKLLFGILALSIVINPYYIYADEISVSGNGEGSTSGVNVNVSQTTQTQQQNTAEVNNNVDVNADTGNNTASDNSGGDTSITTGDINIDSSIQNEGINQSSVELDCCQGDLSAQISGNGSNSTNSINYSVNEGKEGGNTNISVYNNANITNNVSGTANTGYNQANNNSGNVSISTGSITVSDSIINKSINVYEVNAPSGNGGDVSISIKDNGSGSTNSITFSDSADLTIDINNSANIVNNSKWDLNTGKNIANGNNGDVSITTGDIVFNSTIENSKINVGLVDIECCEEDEGGPGPGPGPDDNPPPVVPPPPPPTSSPCVKNCGSSNPTSQGGPGGEVLPVTGSASLLFLAIANIIMFFMGWYLRLRSGRSPNFVYAV